MTGSARGALALAGLLLAHAPVAAQVSLGPLGGQATAHLGAASGSDDRGSTLSAGASIAILEEAGWGAEVDFGYADNDRGRTGGLNVQSYMLNVMGMWPHGRLRPFLVAGLGGLRGRTCASGCAEVRAWSDWGWSAGGGVQYVLRESFAVRGDVRYLTTLADHPDPSRPRHFNFWRVAVGGTYLWSLVD
ncbi:MAG: outer membrane beta-barrel protein [Acidobacteria bacterium]|nr:outer membrane beta-barrel protein [Acidobacteriota bacterium]